MYPWGIFFNLIKSLCITCDETRSNLYLDFLFCFVVFSLDILIVAWNSNMILHFPSEGYIMTSQKGAF